MLLAARQISEYTRGISLEDFRLERRTRESTLYQFIVLGEASKRISLETRTELSYLPWSSMAQMRDFLAHHYDEVNFKKVWETATMQIPDLITSFEPLLPILDSRPPADGAEP